MDAFSKTSQLQKTPQKQRRQRKCKECKKWFTPEQDNQICCCIDCAIAYNKIKKQKQKRKAIKQYRETDKASLLRIAEKEVNRYIRMRDIKQPCISCCTPAGYRQEAGHYRSKGGHGATRFNTLNIHSQCHVCNYCKSANLEHYRKNLIVKIGLEKVEWLESQNNPRKYTVEYLQKLIKVFRNKIKLLERRDNEI